MNKNTEQEIKLFIKDIPSTLQDIRNVADYTRTQYIRDVIYGREEDKKKIRLRIEDNFETQSVNAIYKYKVSIKEGIKKEIEETIYKGSSLDDALKEVKNQGDFVEENSYEKTRILFLDDHKTEITVDIYPFGTWVEIEGDPVNIHKLAKKLGYSKKDYIDTSADDLYLSWIKEHNLPEQWDVRFGLGGKR